tara:strand:+ start:81 stop:1331 length:1251 start_codon:yes stop_codon:yes gene_type:complete
MSEDKSQNPQNSLRFLVQSLIVMIEDTDESFDNILSNLPKEIINVDGRKILSDRGEKLETKFFIKTEAHLVYAFSLYERYLGSLLKYALHSDKDLLQRYRSKWVDLLDSKNKSSPISSSILLDDEALIAEYSILQQSLGVNGVNLNSFISSLLGIRYKKDEESLVTENLAKFEFFIEARNLFVHRGSLIDKSFLKKLEQKRIFKNNKLLLEKFLDEQYLLNKIKENDSSKLLNRMLRIKLREVVSVIIFNACWMTLHINRTCDLDDKESFTGVSHILLDSEKVKLREVFELVFNNIKLYLFEDNIQDMPDILKFNYFLTIYELTRYYSFYIDKKSKNLILSEQYKQKIKENKRILSSFDKSLFNKLNEEKIELLKCYIEDDKERFLEIFKKSDIKQHKDSNWKDSFIFKRWMSDLE